MLANWWNYYSLKLTIDYLRDTNVFLLFLCIVIRAIRDIENEKFCYKIIDTENLLVNGITTHHITSLCLLYILCHLLLHFRQRTAKKGVNNKLLKHKISVEKYTCSAN